MPETIPLPVLRWPCDLARPAPHRVQIFRGETVRLEALLTLNGAPVEIPAGATATLAWQSRDMGGSWYTAAANIDAERGSVWADFGPDNDAGADEYRAFLRVDSDGACYRAVAALQILTSPGAVINEIPIPPRVLDFATIEVLNAPYWTKQEADARFASTADATLTPTAFGPWEYTIPDGFFVSTLAYIPETGQWAFGYSYDASVGGPGGGSFLIPGDGTELELSGVATVSGVDYTLIATRTVTAYRLGPDDSANPNRDKPLAPASAIPAVVAPSTDAADDGKAADAKATGDALAGKLNASVVSDAPRNGLVLVSNGLSVVADPPLELNNDFLRLAPSFVSSATEVTNSTLVSALRNYAPLTSLPSSETWTFEVDDGQGGTTIVTKSVAVYAPAAQGGA